MNVVAIAFGLFIGLAPFALGSNRPLPWGYNAVLAGGLLVMVAIVILVRQDRSLGFTLRPVRVPLFLICVVLVWAVLQALALGLFEHPYWSYVRTILGDDIRGHISINPYETWISILRWTTCLAAFLTAYVLASDPRRARLMLWMLLFFATLYAFYGFYRIWAGPEQILWFDTRNHLTLSSTFVNRNHAATYFGMAAIVSFALFYHQIRRSIDGQGQALFAQKFARFMSALAGTAGVAAILLILFVSTLIATASRGGLIFTLAGVFTMLVLFFFSRGRSQSVVSRVMTLALSLAAVVMMLVMAEFAGARLVERLVDDGLSAGGRIPVYKETLGLIATNPITGTGLGTFQDAYPIVRGEAGVSRQVWDKAHNDYLETFLGLGIPAALLFFSALAMLFAKCVTGFFRRRQDRIYSAIAVAVGLQVGLHSLVDFSLQIQANALVFVMIMGIGLAQSTSSRNRA